MPHYFLTSKNNGPVLLCTAIKYKLGIETISYRPLSHNGHFVPGDLKSFVFAQLALLAVRMRLAVQIQSFFNLLEQNGCLVTRVYCL